MGRVFAVFHNGIENLHSAAYVLAGAALLSQLLALVRDRMLAHAFGASAALDVYYAAFRVQDFIYLSIASLVSLSVLLPLIVEKEKDKEELRKFLSRVASAFFMAVIAGSLVAFFFSPYIVEAVFGGLLGRGYDTELLFLTRLLLISPAILGLSSILGAVVQAEQRFILYAMSPVLYNLGIISGIFFLAPEYGIVGVGFGVILGAFLHLLIQVPFLYRRNLLPLPTWNFSLPELKVISSLSIPRTLSLSLSHISLVVLTALAAFGEEGSISVFGFALNLQSAPLAVIGASYSMAAFPALARLWAGGEVEAFKDKAITALRHIFFWALPAVSIIIVLRAHIVRVVLGTGAFDWTDTRLTAACLAVFSVSILFQSVILLLTRAYYASGETRAPLYSAVLGASLTVILAFLFSSWFSSSMFFRDFLEALLRVEGLSGTGILVYPLSYSLGSGAATIFLLYSFVRRFGGLRHILSSFALHFSASVIISFSCYQLLMFLAEWLPTETGPGLFFQALIAGIVGIGVGIFVLYSLRSEELSEVFRSLKARLPFTGVFAE